MMRLCVIGDSHIAAMKTGWDELSSQYGRRLAVTYFGAQSQMLDGLDVRGSIIVPSSEDLGARLAVTSGGKCEIDARDYDAFMVVGLGLNFRRLMTMLLPRFRTTEFALMPPGVFCLSDACLSQAATGVLRDSLAIETVAKLKAAGAADIVLLPQPVPSETILDRAGEGALFRAFAESGDGPRAYDLFRRSAKEIAEGHGLRFVEQPEKTRRLSFLSRAEYSAGSVRLTKDYNEAHPSDDFGHMNGKYGVEMWTALIDGRHVAA